MQTDLFPLPSERARHSGPLLRPDRQHVLLFTLALLCLCARGGRTQAPPTSNPVRGRVQDRTGSVQDRTGGAPEKAGSTQEQEKEAKEEAPVVTKHTIQMHGVALNYTATVGKLPIKNAMGETEAQVFYMAYTVPPVANEAPRPLIFAYNGGPGASSVYLHMGAIGPRRVKMQDEGWMPPPPYQLVDNEYTLLGKADLVFIDPVGTGYSRPIKPELGKKFWGLHGDIESLGEFIRLYLTRNDRWTSPLFLLGESYGTMRSAGLANSLFERGIALNGVVLISSVLNFQTLAFARGNDLPYTLIVPSYSAIAWYHKKLPPDLQRDRAKTLAEVERWATTEYAAILAQGDRLTPQERQAAVEKLARYTGLPKQYVDQANLRISVAQFCKELLRDEKRSVGRYDGRFTGIEPHGVAEYPRFDPSAAATGPPFSATFSQYVRTELGYKTDAEYHFLSYEVNAAWDWGTRGFGYADTSEELRSALAKNPYTKLFVAAGYYDLATPFYEARYMLEHLDLDPGTRSNVQMEIYEGGHMMYLVSPSHAKLQTDIEKFLQSALPTK